jgi:UDP:flavonoid glycosyltransferase YjiC (YdhE family)
MPPPHLLLALSGHGYGHLAQCAPVINALWAEHPDLKLTVCGALPQDIVAERLDRPFDYHCVELDPVLQMFNAWEVNVLASQQVYREFHDNRDVGLQQDLDLLRQLSPDLVLADIPWRILSAAAQLGIPAIGLCSLNWAAIYAAYCQGDSKDRQMIAQMISAYQTARVFLNPEPSIPMPQLDNTQAIGPIARRGIRQKPLICTQQGIPQNTNIVLIALGGITTDMPLEHWPRIDNTVWIFSSSVCLKRDDFLDVSTLDMPFVDVLASADVVLTKPGYGTYAEAVCNGVPVLTIERPDWPETNELTRWVRRYGYIEVMTREQFYSGTFVSQVKALLARSTRLEVESTGIGQAVEHIQSLLH